MVFFRVFDQSGSRRLVFCHGSALGLPRRGGSMALAILECNQPAVQSTTDAQKGIHCAVVGDCWLPHWFVARQLDVTSSKMNRITSIRVILLSGLLATSASGHIGSPNVFFEGQAGSYPVHVVIQPAEVIPGLAQISIRVDGTGVE